jgi:sterol desaturase/sphingolipid hydroxylase (fatty acid hydroxylase superfamily)
VVALVLLGVTFVALLGLEHARPGRSQPAVRGWYAKGFASFGVAAAAYALLLPRVVEAGAALAPVHAPAVAAPLAVLLADAVFHPLHRALHHSRPLWRAVHRLHHSAQRVDVAGTAYMHPLDLALQLAALAAAVIALGLPPAGAAAAGYIALTAQLVAHVNVRTPQWLGRFVQRPEAHSVHHTRGVHAYNYGTLPLWDIVLGTFRNPATFSTEPAGLGEDQGENR